MQPIFVTGIGTDIGKTVVSGILVNALKADYWKPVQAGDDETDSNWISSVTDRSYCSVHPELYRLHMPASPHIAARAENKKIETDHIVAGIPVKSRILIIEGAGGLMVPLNETTFIADLIKALQAKVVLVSRNYLGSINHSLLTAKVCKEYDLDVAGWIFNDNYLEYEDEIVKWSGYQKICSIPYCENPGPDFVRQQAAMYGNKIADCLC